MNKYEKALYIYSHLESETTVGEYTPLEYEKAIKKLEELVERATPKKPIIEYIVDGYYYRCQNCGELILEKNVADSVNGKRIKKNIIYCSKCGTKIDWSEEE